MTYVVVNITLYLPEVWRILCKISWGGCWNLQVPSGKSNICGLCQFHADPQDCFIIINSLMVLHKDLLLWEYWGEVSKHPRIEKSVSPAYYSLFLPEIDNNNDFHISRNWYCSRWFHTESGFLCLRWRPASPSVCSLSPLSPEHLISHLHCQDVEKGRLNF